MVGNAAIKKRSHLTAHLRSVLGLHSIRLATRKNLVAWLSLAHGGHIRLRGLSLGDMYLTHTRIDYDTNNRAYCVPSSII